MSTDEGRPIPMIQEIKGSGLFFTDEAEAFLATVGFLLFC